jgi:hypothetical protein
VFAVATVVAFVVASIVPDVCCCSEKQDSDAI